MSAASEQGVALRCGIDGVIRAVVRDDFDLGACLAAGAPLHGLADPAARAKMHAFCDAVARQRAVFDWEITVALDGALVPLHFAGVRSGSEILVVAARSLGGLAQVNEELMRINNDQVNATRTIAKDLAEAKARTRERDDSLYDELSRVNNELANLQREMARKNVELGRLNEDKNRLLGMAAHDLRSPLGVIQSYAEFLETEAELDGEQREFLAIIRQTSDFMRRLVDDLLDLSRIEAGRLRLDREPTDLPALVRRNVALNAVLAARKGVAIELDVQGDRPLFELDRAKIEQVLNNLLGNAVKFCAGGSTVRVQLSATAGAALIAIRDQGPGIAEQDLPGLFKPFATGTARGTAGEGSTGLGLAIARRIVEGHGGRIGVHSTPGAGACFWFELPRVPAYA